MNYANGFFTIPNGVVFNGGGTSTMKVDDRTDSAANSYTVTGASVGRNGTPLTYNGINALTLDTSAGNATVGVLATLSGAVTSINTGAGNDTVSVIGAYDLAHGFLSNVLAGQLLIDEKAGSNQLSLNEAMATTAHNLTVSATAIFSTPHPFSLGYKATGGTFANGLVLTTGSGNNVVAVVGTTAGSVTGVVGGAGDDTFGVDGAGVSSGLLGEALAGPVILDGGGGNNRLTFYESGATTGDTLTLTANSLSSTTHLLVAYQATGGTLLNGVVLLTGSGADAVTVLGTAANAITVVGTEGGNDTVAVTAGSGLLVDALGGSLVIDEGTGSNNLTFNEAAATVGDNLTLTATQLVGAEPGRALVVNYAATGGTFGAGLGVVTGAGADVVVVQATPAGSGTVVNTGAGNDTVAVAAVSGLLSGALGGPVSIDAGAGSNSLSFSEAASTMMDILALVGGQVSSLTGPFAVSYQATGGTIASLVVSAGSGATTFDVEANVLFAFPPTLLNGGSGSNVFNVTDVTGGASFTDSPLSPAGTGVVTIHGKTGLVSQINYRNIGSAP